MRIWHYELIDVLPNAQLKAMRYEIGDMIKQYPNIKHGLVKYANNYDIEYLLDLFMKTLDEFEKRKIKHRVSYDLEIYQIGASKCKLKIGRWKFIRTGQIYPEHNDRYLKQCYFNLQEKYDRGIISKEEWQKIYNKYKDKFDLWDGEE